MRTLLIVDYANLKSSVKDMGFKLDIKRFLSYFRSNYNIMQARFYYGLDTRNKLSSRFLYSVSKIGFIVVSKKVKYICIKKGTNPIFLPKCNFDVEITLDITKYINDFDELVLISGDGDFAPCSNIFRRK